MKRILIAAALAALMLLPASALARHGDHKLKHRHGTVGTVTAYDASTGELTLTAKKGRALSALVTDDTRLRCSDDDSSASASRHGDDDGEDHDRGDDHGGDDGEHHSDDDASDCVPAVGDVVRRARIDLTEDDAVWTKLKLA